MPKKQITEAYGEVVDRKDWFGDDSLETTLIRFMLCNPYAMAKIVIMCGNNPNVFMDGPNRIIAHALFSFYEETHGVVDANPGRKGKIDAIYRNHFSSIRDTDEYRDTCRVFRDCLQEGRKQAHYYRSEEEADIVLGQSELYFEHIKAEILREALVAANEQLSPIDYIAETKKAVAEYTSVGQTDFKRMGADNLDSIGDEAFAEIEDPIFKLPPKLGAFAEVLNSQLIPGGFIAFLGPEKRGKSWLLQELAMYSAKYVPTLFIQAGDMNLAMVYRRLAVRLLQRSYKERYCGELYIPVLDCKLNQNGTCRLDRRCGKSAMNKPRIIQEMEVEIETNEGKKKEKKQKDVPAYPNDYLEINADYVPCAECARCNDPTWKPAYFWTKRNPVVPIGKAEAKKAVNDAMGNWHGSLEVLEFPSDTLTISRLKSICAAYAAQGLRFKVIILDYMDLLKAEKFNSREYRHFQNELWKSMRGFLQEQGMLGITATQANVSGQDALFMDMQQISEDKRKAAHVTAFWGLNQTKHEKACGIMRLNQVVVRDDEFDASVPYYILQSLATGQPLLASFQGPRISQSK